MLISLSATTEQLTIVMLIGLIRILSITFAGFIGTGCKLHARDVVVENCNGILFGKREFKYRL